MANTEILKVLQLVREAKKAVNEALYASPGMELEELSTSLEAVEGVLIAAALDEKLAQLRQYQKQLVQVNATLNTEIKELQAVSEKVARAAQALEILIEIIGSVAALGTV